MPIRFYIAKARSNLPLLGQNTLSFHSSAARFTSKSSGPKNKSHPNPVGFLVLSVAAFGAFAYLSRKRHDDPERSTREKRIPHPNPLIPPRTQDVQ